MRFVVASVVAVLLSSPVYAVEPTTTTPTAPAPAAVTNTAAGAIAVTANTTAVTAHGVTPAQGKPLTAEQIAKNKTLQEAKTKALIKDQSTRLQQLEQANLDALAQNQELQLKNDNLGVQVQVLQSERSAQMFLYGAATLAVGVLLGFLIASYVYTKRRRQW